MRLRLPGKKKSNMCSGGNENQDTFTLLYLHLLILDASFEAFMELTFPFIRCSWLGICWAIPHNLGGRRCKEGGFLFNKQCYYFPPLTAYAKSFVGEKKIPRKKKKKRSVHNNNYLCPFCFCSFHVRELFSRAARVTALEGWNISC